METTYELERTQECTGHYKWWYRDYNSRTEPWRPTGCKTRKESVEMVRDDGSMITRRNSGL